MKLNQRAKEFVHPTIYFLQRNLYHRIEALWKFFLFRAQGYYFFRLKYFGKYERVKLARYFGWHLWEKGNRLSLAVENSIDEYRALKTILANAFPNGPDLAMDFGCGSGRSSIFFKNMLGWNSTSFKLVDSHQSVYGDSANMLPSQSLFHHDIGKLRGNFYTDFDLIDRFLLSNHMYRYDLIDLRTERYKLATIKDVNLFYSFYSAGYHYDIKGVFDNYGIHDLLKPGALLIVGIRRKNDPLHNELSIDNLIQSGYNRLEVVEGCKNQDFLIMKKSEQ